MKEKEELFDVLDRMSTKYQDRRQEEKEQRIEKADKEIRNRIRVQQIADRHKPVKRSSYRPARPDSNQPDFFTPSVTDVPLKDDISLMDIAPFRLSKRYQRKAETMTFHVKGAEIEVRSDNKGMATIYDYDLILMMISELTEKAELWRQGKRHVPETKFAPSVYDIMRFCQRSTNGREYENTKDMLDRLLGTKIVIDSDNEKLRRTGGFNLIDGYMVISKTKSGRIGQVSIGIPGWIYDGIVKPKDKDKKPTVLTYNPDYFRLDSAIARFIYRFARKAARTEPAVWALDEVHYHSGSQGEFKKFAYLIRQIVAANDLPDYHLAIRDGRHGQTLVMTPNKADKSC